MDVAIRSIPEARKAPLPGPGFVHLKVHSAYSLLEGALPIGEIARLAQQHGMPAVALTDTGNLFGALEFSEKLAASGIQPIVGLTVQADFGDAGPAPNTPRPSDGEDLARPAGSIALLAASRSGYAHLVKLATEASLGPRDTEPTHIKIAALARHAEGLIALTGGSEGPIDTALRHGQKELARERLMKLQRIFGDSLYVELQRHGQPQEHEVEAQLLELAYALGIPIVATNECYFSSPDDCEAHDVLLCIAAGAYVGDDDRRRSCREHYFKSAAEMARLFADLPEALANTVEIAKRCAFRPESRAPILPKFAIAGSADTESGRLAAEAAELARQAEEGLAQRLARTGPAQGFSAKDYADRLAFELDVIGKMKFPGYFLIVADFIKWAKANGIPVGPGRGSGAGSLVAWALTITDLDPLRFGLLFERFLNPERVSMPDFDIDFCQDRRDEVIGYVQRKYGADRVAQIITHGKLQARAVLRDVGRVLQMPYGQVDKLCKLVPNNPANPVSLKDAIAGEPKLQEAREREPIVARLLEIAEKLEGLYRHASTHAAGIVIGDRPLDELVPLYRDPKSRLPITQFNWKMVEAAGLVKFDFLGLKTLTVLKKAADLIEQGGGPRLDMANLPLDDAKTYELLARADTVGVFQLESTGMRESLKRLKPDRIEDIIAMVALYRPGPMDNIQTYINRKHGLEPVDYLHPMLEGILKETHGVIIYQEQVIQIAQVMAGYTLGQADLLRRAMGKKDKKEMAKQQARFVEGARRNGVSAGDAAYIFELVDKFAGYGFNKSHAAAYALLSYQTAYLKANYREEFLAASMTLDMGNTDKLAMFAAEARKSGIAVLPPCINSSAVDFVAERPRPDPHSGRDAQPPRAAIRYSLAALKNIGTSAAESVVAERTAHGPYKTLGDFAARLNARVVTKRALETLAAAGAFDALESNRALVAAHVEAMLALSARLQTDREAGTGDLFASPSTPTLDVRATPPWTPMERLTREFEAVGFYLSGHPLDQYAPLLGKLGVRPRAEFEAEAGRGAAAARLAGIVVSARERKSQKGNRFAFVVFSDTAGQFEAVVFSDQLAQARELLEPGTPVLLMVEAESDGDSVKMRVQQIDSLDKAVAGLERGLKIVLDHRTIAARPGSLGELKSRLRAGGKGEVRLLVCLEEAGREMELVLPGRYDVSPTQRGALSVVPCVRDVVEI